MINLFYLIADTATATTLQAPNIGGPATFGDIINIVTNFLLGIAGTLSVIMIIIGGIRYATSGGNENATKGAKDTILSAVIGLVVTILAYSIVNYVIKTVFKG
ncbi:MAG: hypothetical protein WCH00_02465 [Candidatus Saccharibacteria bacterium]